MRETGWLSQTTIKNNKDKPIEVKSDVTMSKLKDLLKTKLPKSSNQGYKANISQLTSKHNRDKCDPKTVKAMEEIKLLERQERIMEKKADMYDQLR